MASDNTAPRAPLRSKRPGPSVRGLPWLPGFSRMRDIWILALLAIAPYLNGLRGGFIFDDRYLAVDHPILKGSASLLKILKAPYWGELQGAMLWRPVTTLSFVIDHRAAHGGTAWFHLVNVLLHAGVTILFWLLVRRLTRREGLALAAGAFFAVHPLHTEAVTWISGRAELLAAFFGLIALHLALPGLRPARGRWLGAVAFLFAIGSKESAATIPLILVFLAWSLPRRDRPGTGMIGASFAAVLVYVLARRAVLGSWSGPLPDPMDNPMVGHGILSRLPTVMDCAGRYLFLILWPARLSVDYSAPALNLVRSMTPLLLLGTVSAAGLLWLGVRRRETPEGLGAAIAILTFALASNIPVVIGTIFAERLFYLPSAGIILVLCAGTMTLAKRIRRFSGARRIRAIQVVFAVLLILGAARTWARNRDYRDEGTMYEAGARAMPKSPKMRYNSALQLNRQGRYEEAVHEGIEALRLNPSSRETRIVIAGSLDSLGRVDEAITMLRKFIRIDPKDRDSRRILITMLMREGEEARADSIAEAGMREDPDFPEWIGRAARGAQQRGDLAHAILLWREARLRAPQAPDAAISLAWCLLASDDARGAVEAYRDAIRLVPGNEIAENGLAWSILESGGDPGEAVRHAEKAVEKERSASNLDTLARAYVALGRCADAVRAAEEAARLEPERKAYKDRLDQARRCR
jgi:protein O-mannosyl-transferase